MDSYNFSSNRASGNYDQRHILNTGYIYDLPFYKGTNFTNKLLGNWQFSGITTFQTGTPFSVVTRRHSATMPEWQMVLELEPTQTW